MTTGRRGEEEEGKQIYKTRDGGKKQRKFKR